MKLPHLTAPLPVSPKPQTPFEIHGENIVLHQSEFIKDFNREKIFINGVQKYGVEFKELTSMEVFLSELLSLGARPQDISKILRFCMQTISGGDMGFHRALQISNMLNKT